MEVFRSHWYRRHRSGAGVLPVASKRWFSFRFERLRIMRGVRLAMALLCVPLTMVFLGCDGGGNGDDGGGGTQMQVTFDSSGGTYAVGQDDAGNQYAFRAREEGGQTIITEANFATADGLTLKASLDSEGRPVNLRMSDNIAADLVYEGNSVKVRLTDADGSVISDGSGIDYTTARARVQARRVTNLYKDPARMQANSTKQQILQQGMETYEEIIESITDEADNPDSPLNKPEANDLKDAARALGDVVSDLDVEEVDRGDLADDVDLDEVPEIIQRLAGNTYILFDAEGFCLEWTDVANRLTFDSNGILQTEFDRHLVFPDFSLGGGGETGVTINYSTGTPINMTPGEDVDFELIVTPVFTGTQLDATGKITVERRFQADLTFEVELFGATEAEASKLFDAAFLNGYLSEDGSLLEFDLVLVDLSEETPALQLGRLRYHDQNAVAPETIFDCEVIIGENEQDSGLACPGSVGEGEDFAVEFLAGRDDMDRRLDYDWFISEGYGIIVGGSHGPETMIRATASGFLEVTLVVSDLGDNPDVFEVYTCGISVGREDEMPPEGLMLECPSGLNIGESGFFAISGPDAAGLEYPNWFVFGTSDFWISDPLRFEVEVEFYQAGRFEVAFQAYDADGREVYAVCEVRVGGTGYDDCEANGWYGDGECDPWCPQPDPDCGDDFIDYCERNGWYGDGECDDFCPRPDPDCDDFIDWCAENGWYGDGECDLFCPWPDPDCEYFDECAENGWYGDGECDPWCPQPDPDCDDHYDICEVNRWYGDGECDEFCPRPDPDCDQYDICFENGWYNDGECDVFCPMPDPDCGGEGDDICAENGWYGDGECDTFCPMPDPDCNYYDVCAENGWYGDGECDEFCPEPDPDCEGFDICAENGWYGDGVCDDCPRPDPDCADICAENGWYGDGECDEFCPLPDPDCTGDICAENGWYGDGECDEFCPLPDPDCTGFDICEENGWYGDGECDDFCPLPDPDCTGDICAENGWYGDGECDEFCLWPDPDCEIVGDVCEENGYYGDYQCDEWCLFPDPDCDDPCVLNGWYWDGECDTFCPLPDPDCEGGGFDICEENGWYGDYECDLFCPLPDPDCEDICLMNGWYWDGMCDEFCPLPDPDCLN